MKALRTLAAAVALLSLSSTGAAAETLHLGYGVDVGILPLGRMRMETDMSDGRYRIAVSARPTSLLNSLFHWSYRAEAEGSLSGAHGVSPDRFSAVRTRRKKSWESVLDYTGGTVTPSHTPPLAEAKANAVPPELRVGTVDLLSASVAIAVATDAAGGNCTATVPVFDGRRRFDVVTAPIEGRRLKKGKNAVYEGEAIGCRVEVAPVAGIPPAEDGDNDFWTVPRDGSRRGFDLWLGRLQAGGPLVPVRLEARELYYADIVATLAKVDGAGTGP